MKANTPVERLYNGIIKGKSYLCTDAGNVSYAGSDYLCHEWIGHGTYHHGDSCHVQYDDLYAEKGHSRWGADACLYCGGGFFCDHRSVPFAGLYSRPL